MPPGVQRALEALELESIEDVESVLGREPDAPTARALAAVAMHLSNSGGLERSALVFEDVLRTRRVLFGDADSATLFALNELGARAAAARPPRRGHRAGRGAPVRDRGRSTGSTRAS